MSYETGEPTAASTEDGEVAEEPAGWSRRRALRGVVGTAAFLLVWWLVAGTESVSAALGAPVLPGTEPYLLPSPYEVAVAFLGQLAASATYSVPLSNADVVLPSMVTHLLQSLQHYVPGLVVGSVLGIATGVAMGWYALLDDALTPLTRILRPIPPLAWIAFAIIWFGTGHAGATFIVAIGAFWINFYTAYSGVEGVPEGLEEVAASLGVHDSATMIRKVILPSASPEILTGLRTSIGQCWMIVVAAELVGPPGVGEEILVAAQNLALDVSVAYMLVISAVFLVSDGLFRRVQREVLAWRA